MKYKYNGQWYDVAVKALDSMEIGCIIQFMGNTIPTGWLECDGSSITQSDYPELYALIGGTLPNFKGRVLVGQDTSDTDFDTLGETGGSKYLQEHSHEEKYESFGLNNNKSALTDYSNNERTITFNAANPGTGTRTGTTGTGNSGNLQPYAVVKHIIKAKNTVPTMASMVNSYSNSTTNGYSCDYVNDMGTSSSVLLNWTNTGSGIVNLSGNITNYRYLLFLLSTSDVDNDGNAYTHFIPVDAIKTIFTNPNNQSSCKAFNLYSSLTDGYTNTRCYFTSDTAIRVWNNSGVTSYVKIIGYK